MIKFYQWTNKMEFFEITEEIKATPGEYIYHEPTQQIVLCGSFNRNKNQIRAIHHLLSQQ